MTDIDRRTLLHGGSAALVSAALVSAALVSAVALTSGAARAAAPPAARQAPGFYRFKVGTLEVTVVSDGTLGFPANGLWSDHAAEVAGVLAAEFRPATPAVLQLNTIVVNTGDKLVLLDSGTGGKFQSTSGALLANLAAAGYAPEQVDAVVFTHLHPDHLWGISDAGNAALRFPNAELVIAETEHGFWSAEALPGQVPAGMKQMVDVTQTNLALAKPKLRLVQAGAEVLPGIATVATPGHTPGHVSIHLASGADQLLVSGDVVANATISFEKPDWAIGFDMDKPQATATRAAFLDRAAADRVLVASYHLPFPAVGHVVRDGAAYRWVPAEWGWM